MPLNLLKTLRLPLLEGKREGRGGRGEREGGGGESNHRGPPPHRTASRQLELDVTEAERVHLTPPADAVPCVGPQGHCDPPDRVQREDGVVGPAIEQGAAEMPGKPRGANDGDGDERAPADRRSNKTNGGSPMIGGP